jgi:anthranilate phosphoribosyltransferase
MLAHLRTVLELRQPLTREAAREVLESVLRGDVADIQLAALLGALTARGETAAELAGFVDAMRAAAVPYTDITAAERDQLVDTCGTGGDASGTFNISTAAALVAAAAGATVAKHGNRAVTSKCGSADVLEALRIPVNLAPAQAAAALRRHRFAFLHAPDAHPAMKAVMPVRRALGVRTAFNIVGPLTNPAGARAQVMGVYASNLIPLVAETMTLLGIRHAMVVHGDGGLSTGIDELAISGPSQVAEIHDGHISHFTVTPEAFGLTRAPITALAGGDAAANARILTAIFTGARGPHREIVLLNAAAVLVTSGIATDLTDGISRSAYAIDSGAVSSLIQSLSSAP